MYTFVQALSTPLPFDHPNFSRRMFQSFGGQRGHALGSDPKFIFLGYVLGEVPEERFSLSAVGFLLCFWPGLHNLISYPSGPLISQLLIF